MRTPGFTANSSLYRTPRQYRTGVVGESARHGVYRAQREDGVRAPGTCCGHYCSGLCSCQSGHFYCSPAVAEESTEGRILMASDFCHATEAVNGSVAISGFNCACGCWATAHDAGCLSCTAAARTEPLTILKA